MTGPGDSAFIAAYGADGKWLLGLTKREYFAAVAMQGLLSCDQEARIKMNKAAAESGLNVTLAIGRMAVAQADALIAELNK